MCTKVEVLPTVSTATNHYFPLLEVGASHTACACVNKLLLRVLQATAIVTAQSLTCYLKQGIALREV